MSEYAGEQCDVWSEAYLGHWQVPLNSWSACHMAVKAVLVDPPPPAAAAVAAAAAWNIQKRMHIKKSKT